MATRGRRYVLRHHVRGRWEPLRRFGGVVKLDGAGLYGTGRGQRGVGGASAIRQARAAVRGSARRVHLTSVPGSAPWTTSSDPGQLRSRAEASGTGSGGRSPSSTGAKHSGLGKPPESCGGASLTQGAAATVTVTGRGTPARDPGWDSKPAAETPPPPRPPHLWATPHRLRRCRRHLRRLAHRSPPVAAPPPRRQAQAAHLDARGCGSRGSDDAAPPHRPGGRRWSERGFVEPGPPPPPSQPPRVPETGRSVPVPGEESRAAGHHERQQRQHHLRQPQAAQARAENVSVGPSASSPRGLGARARGCGRRPPSAPKSGRSGD